MDSKKHIQSIDRALDILEYLCENGNDCRLMDISIGLSLNKSTVYNIISTLESRRYIYQNPMNLRYSIGVSSIKLGLMNMSDFPSLSEIHDILTYLRDSTGESTVFAIHVNKKYFYFDYVAANRIVEGSYSVGTFEDVSLPSSLGKLFRGLSNGDKLPYVFDFEEIEKGLNCFAFPHYRNNILIGAIVISGPSSRCTKELFLKGYDLYLEYIKKLN